MGFFVNEINHELKQHLNLSEKAWEVIYNDMTDFYRGISNHNLSGFLNQVFTHFYQDASGSIGIRSKQAREELWNIIAPSNRIPSDADHTEEIIAVLVQAYKQKLVQKAHEYPKGRGEKFRVNRKNIDILRDSDSSDFYDDSIGTYMKAVFEEYTSMPPAQREIIFFKDIIDECNIAISQRKKVKISLLGKISDDGTHTYTPKFYVSPHTIASDKSGNFNYLVGISEEIKEDGTIGEKRIASFRISRIDKISVMNSLSGFMSKQKIEEIKKELRQKTPQYMAGDLSDIEVAFTKKGVESLERQIYLRPTSYEKIHDNTYVFHCTELQAFHYFFKFGEDAIILEPQSLREKMKQCYQKACEAYDD